MFSSLKCQRHRNDVDAKTDRARQLPSVGQISLVKVAFLFFSRMSVHEADMIHLSNMNTPPALVTATLEAFLLLLGYPSFKADVSITASQACVHWLQLCTIVLCLLFVIQKKALSSAVVIL